MTRARIAVLGADGFVGRAMVAALSNTAWAAPVAIGRRQVRPAPDGPERRQLDASDERALRPALEDVDGVINCVLGDAGTIVRNAHALFGIGAARPGLRVVHVSTMSVYGSATGDVDEDATMRGDVGPYSVAKVEAERIATQCAQASILRPGIVYGPGGPQWSVRIAQWLFERRIGDIGAAGDGYCNLIHVADVARAAVLALENPAAAGEVFNLSMEEPPTWNDYFQRFAKALGAVPTVRVSQRRLAVETRLIAAPLKVLEILCARAHLSHGWLPQPIPPSILPLWRQEIRLSMRKTTRMLGLQCKPLADGMRETAEAFRTSLPTRGSASRTRDDAPGARGAGDGGIPR